MSVKEKVQINVLDYQSDTTNPHRDTMMIQQAIDQAAKSNACVLIPKGTYLVGSLFLREKSHLIFEEGAVLKGMTDLQAFPEIPTRVAGIEMKWPAALLNALSVNDIIIEGKGIIDCQGEYWWNLYWGKDKKSGKRAEYDQKGLRWIADYAIKRPRACLIYESKNITIKDVLFQHSGFWNLQITYSQDVLVDHIVIRENDGPSTDGIDIDSSSNVHITRCDLACGDDCIAIKSGRDGNGARVDRKSRGIEIDHCQIRSGYGITIGSEVSAGIEDVHIHDIDFKNSDCGFRMKSSKERGGVIENIRVENLTMQDVQFPFSWIMDWHNAYNRKTLPENEQLSESWQAVAEQISEERQMTKVKDIKINNVIAIQTPEYSLPSRAFDFVAFAEKPMENIVIENCNITAKEFGRIEAVKNLKLEHVVVSIEEGNNKQNDFFDNR